MFHVKQLHLTKVCGRYKPLRSLGKALRFAPTAADPVTKQEADLGVKGDATCVVRASYRGTPCFT